MERFESRLFQPSEVIAVCYGTYTHYAIVGDRLIRGKPTLIAMTERKGTVCEESWSEGTQGRPVRKTNIRGCLPASEVLDNARRLIGQQSYSLLGFNCEHFARWAHGLPVESKQVAKGVVGTLLGGLLAYKLSGGDKRMVTLGGTLGALGGIALARQSI